MAEICLPLNANAIMTLCLPMRPHVYEFVSDGCYSKSSGASWRLSSWAAAAARSMGSAAIHPIAYDTKLVKTVMLESGRIQFTAK